MTLSPREIANVTGILGHIAGILEQLPLEEYELALRDRGGAMWSEGGPTSPVVRERVARYAALRSAARHGGQLADELTRALAHQQAAYAAEIEAAKEPAPTGRPITAVNDAHAEAIRRAYPDTEVVVPLDRYRSPLATDPELIRAANTVIDGLRVPRGGIQFDGGPDATA